MTFKHIGFTDSSVMRSLEKVAIEKGLVKPEMITKSAEALVAERDLSPTNNFSQDIVKLCSGLRRAGFNKHAEEIEINYINYKKAQTLYETFKETGEDLIDIAHPDGPHVFEDVEGKPKVLDIVSRQKEIMKIVDKQPRGKLISIAASLRIPQNNSSVKLANSKLKDAARIYDALIKVVKPLLKKDIDLKLDKVTIYPGPSIPPATTIFGSAIRYTAPVTIKGSQFRFKNVKNKLMPWGAEDPESIFSMGVPRDVYTEKVEPAIEQIDLLIGTEETNDSPGNEETAYNLAKTAENEISPNVKNGEEDNFDEEEDDDLPSPSEVSAGSTGSRGTSDSDDDTPSPGDVGVIKPGATLPIPVPTSSLPPGKVVPTSGDRTDAQKAQDGLYFDVFKLINSNIKRLDAFRATSKVKNDKNLLNWISHLIKYFKDIKSSYSKVEDKKSVFLNLKDDTQKGINSVNKFYEQYILIPFTPTKKAKTS